MNYAEAISCEDGDVRGVWTNGSATSVRDGITGSGFHGGLANGVVHPDMPMDTHPNDNLLGFPGSGSDDLTNYRPEFFSEGVASPAGYTDIIPTMGLRGDNRFVIEPVNLFQGLDAGVEKYMPDVACSFHGCGPVAAEYLKIS